MTRANTDYPDLGIWLMGFQLTLKSARSAIVQAYESLESLAFATIIKNRVNRGMK
jgi:DNA adenine methylase